MLITQILGEDQTYSLQYRKQGTNQKIKKVFMKKFF